MPQIESKLRKDRAKELKVKKLDENAATFILQGAIDYIRR